MSIQLKVKQHMHEFVIKSEGRSVTFHSRSFSSDGWLSSYVLTGEGPGFSGEIEVVNLPYGTSPAALLKEVAEEWSGWKGEKNWGAIEGEFYLSATCDSLGHVTFVIALNPNGFHPSWSASLSLAVEAGQLEELSKDAALFFNESV